MRGMATECCRRGINKNSYKIEVIIFEFLFTCHKKYEKF